jgi:hypothetical protein
MAALGIHIDDHDRFVLATSDSSMEPEVLARGHLDFIGS